MNQYKENECKNTIKKIEYIEIEPYKENEYKKALFIENEDRKKTL